LAAILKILKTKSTTLSDDLFLCQASKGSAVWSEFKKIGTLVTTLIGQTLSQLPWKQKRGDLNFFWIPFIKLHETL
jgi:hypothetical protein